MVQADAPVRKMSTVVSREMLGLPPVSSLLWRQVNFQYGSY